MSFDAGSVTGGLKFDISEYAHGILEAQAVSAVFPAIVTEFLEAPLLALIQVAKEAASFVVESVEKMAGAFHDIGLAAEKAGVSVEFLSKLSAAAKPAGVSLDALVSGFKILEQRAELAGEGNEAAIKGFNRLGISASQLKVLMEEPQKLFETVKQSIGSIEDPALRTAAALGVMGRGGFNLVPLLTKSEEEINKYTDTIKTLGGNTTEEQTKMGAKFGELEGIISAAWAGIQKTVAVPILQFVSEHFDEIVAKVVELAGEIREGLSGAVKFLTPIVKSLWTGLSGLGGVVSSILVPAFNILAPVLQIIGGLLSTILDIIGPVLSGIGIIVSGVTDAIGLTGGDGGGGRSAGGGGQGDTYVVNATIAPIDADEASTQIAEKLRPHILEAKQKQQKELNHAAHKQNVNATLRGDR